MEKEDVPIGQSPWAILTVKNLTDREIVLHASMYHRLQVEGEKGEPPTTRVQRSITGKLKSGEAPVETNEYVVWSIAPAKSDTHKFELTYFYDLAEPGKYTIYLEVMAPSSHKWLRTNAAYFEMRAVTK